MTLHNLSAIVDFYLAVLLVSCFHQGSHAAASLRPLLGVAATCATHVVVRGHSSHLVCYPETCPIPVDTYWVAPWLPAGS